MCLLLWRGRGGEGGSRAAAREVCLVWGGGRDGKEEEEEEDSVFQMKPPSSVQPLSPYIFCASAFKSTIILLSPERPRPELCCLILLLSSLVYLNSSEQGRRQD